MKYFSTYIKFYNILSAVVCPVPTQPQQGRVMYNTVTYNSLISYECNYGYMLIGQFLTT